MTIHYLLPDADVSATGGVDSWPTTGLALYSKVDELPSAPNDADGLSMDPGGSIVRLLTQDPSLTATQRIRAVGGWVRWFSYGGTFQTAVKLREGSGGSAPESTTISTATRNNGSSPTNLLGTLLATSPAGGEWTAAKVAATRLCIENTGGNGCQVRSCGIYYDLKNQPVAVVSAPTTATSEDIKVIWASYLQDEEAGAVPASYHLRVFSQAQYTAGGFDPQTTVTDSYSSGIVGGGGTPEAPFNNTAWSHEIPVLNPGTYRAYVRVAKLFNGVAWWSAWAYRQFTVVTGKPVVVPTSPINNQLLDRAAAITLAWNYTDAEGDPQASFDVEVRRQGSPSAFLSDSGTTDHFYSISPGTSAYGINEWRVRATDDQGNESEWSSWASFTANQAPLAPTLQAPVGDAYAPVVQTTRFSWTFNDPDFGDRQSRYELSIREVGDPSYTVIGPVTSANSFADFPAGTFTADSHYEWKVRTWDAQNLASPYSTLGYFTAVAAPLPSIVLPAPGEVITGSSSELAWTWPTQDAYEVRRLSDNAGVPGTDVYYDSGVIEHPLTRSVMLDVAVSGRYEHFQVRTRFAGLWSEWASVRVQIVLVPGPPTATLALRTSEVAGLLEDFPDLEAAHLVLVTLTTPGEGESEADHVEVWRREYDFAADDPGIRIVERATSVSSTVYAHVDFMIASEVGYSYRAASVTPGGVRTFGSWSDLQTLYPDDDVFPSDVTYPA